MSAYLTHPGRLWPSAEQTLLLRAALLDGEEAVAAFRQWRGGIDLEAEFGRPVMRLLPLVYANLLRLGVDDPLLGRLKGVYRLAWCENQRLFHKMQPVLAHLRAGGVDLLLLKGVPLALDYYDSLALRPMSDFDLAVRPEHLQRAIALLAELGWHGDLPPPSAEDLRYRHAWWCGDSGGGHLDVHYHILRDCLGAAADRWFWSSLAPLDAQGVAALQLDPTAMLFHTVIHGVRWNEETPIRWIPDALTIVRKRGGDIDWERLLAFAAGQRLTQRLALGLRYLALNFGLKVPDPIWTRLQNHRPGLRERIEDGIALADYSRWHGHPVGKQWVMFTEYCRYAQGFGAYAFAAGYPHYLRYRWGLRGRAEIVAVVCRGLWRRLRGGGEDSC